MKAQKITTTSIVLPSGAVLTRCVVEDVNVYLISLEEIDPKDGKQTHRVQYIDYKIEDHLEDGFKLA